MNYKVIDSDNGFDVFETQSMLVIDSFLKKENAKNLAKSLNFGNGFDGFTPTFFVKNKGTINANNKKNMEIWMEEGSS